MGICPVYLGIIKSTPDSVLLADSPLFHHLHHHLTNFLCWYPIGPSTPSTSDSLFDVNTLLFHHICYELTNFLMLIPYWSLNSFTFCLTFGCWYPIGPTTPSTSDSLFVAGTLLVQQLCHHQTHFLMIIEVAQVTTVTTSDYCCLCNYCTYCYYCHQGSRRLLCSL